MSKIVVTCPHCGQYAEIIEIKCGIFRHGVYKKSHQQINPHMSQKDCEKLTKNAEIFGCGKPFRLVKVNDIYVAEICGYI